MNHIELPMFSKLLQKIILDKLCDHINSYNRSFKIKKQNDYFKLLNVSLVSWYWFNTISSLLNVSINFNYDSKFNLLINDKINDNNNNKNSNNNRYIIDIETLTCYDYDKDDRYSLLKINNIETIKLDYIFIFADSCFYQRLYDSKYNDENDACYIVKFTNHLKVFNKLKEMKQLKTILIRTHTFSKDKYLEYYFKVDELLQMGYKDIQFSHVVISNNLMKSIQSINKVKSLILNSNDIQITYDMVKHFNNKGLKRLYIKSENAPIKQLSGIHLYNEINQSGYNYNNESMALNQDGINYLKGIKYIELLVNLSFEYLNIIISSITDLKELKINVCFNHLIYSLSNETHLRQLGFIVKNNKNEYYCIGGCCHCATIDQRIIKSKQKKQDIQYHYSMLLESFKKTKLNRLVLNHGCSVYKNRMDSSDVINNKHNHDKSYLSFLETFTPLIMVIPQLNQLEINGINNPIIFKYLINRQGNKTIQHYKQTIGFSWLPIDMEYNKLFQNLVKQYNHIKSFQYYDQSIGRGNLTYYFNYKNNN